MLVDARYVASDWSMSSVDLLESMIDADRALFWKS
jgi:hypothetical protein